MSSFADRLREEIEYLGLSQKELAYKADVKKRALDMYLGTRASMPPADVAVRLAKALNVTVEYLVTGEKDSNNFPKHEKSDFQKEIEGLSKQTRQVLETAVHLFSEYEKKE